MERTRASSSSSSDAETVCIEINTKPHHVEEKFAELEVKSTYSLCPIKYRNRLNIDSKYLKKLMKTQPNALRVSYEDGTAYTSRRKMRHIGKQLRRMQTLQKLDVTDGHDYLSWIANGGAKHLGESLKYIHSLKTLDLCFEKNGGRLTNWDLHYLSQGLKSLSQLQSFSLSIDNGYWISDQGLEYLGQGLRSLNSLETIKLRFSKCSRIGDAGLAFLSKGLKHLSLVKNFSFDFSSCNEISDLGLKNISEGLKHMTSVQSITLDFKCCTQITDQGLTNLSEGIKKLRSLRKIELYFDRCHRITDKGLKSFNKKLKSLVSLKKIQLECQKIRHPVSETCCEAYELLFKTLILLIIVFLGVGIPFIVADSEHTTSSSK